MWFDVSSSYKEDIKRLLCSAHIGRVLNHSIGPLYPGDILKTGGRVPVAMSFKQARHPLTF